MKVPFLSALLLCPVLAPSAALAQDKPDPTLLGAGVRARPAYDGSADQRADIVPVVRWYRGALFARTTQGVLEAGARYRFSPNFHAGAQVAYEGGRDDRESARLRAANAPDHAASASVGLHAEWDTKVGPAPLTLLGRMRQHVDVDQGMQADLRLTAGVYQRGSLALGVFGQSTWASTRYVRTYYGQPGFSPTGGLLHLGAGVLGAYDLAAHWVLVGSLEGRRLHGDAASSPLVERRSNWYGSAGLAYRF